MDTGLTAWLLPILGSAVLLGFYDICKKQAVKENAVMPALFWATFSGSAFFILVTLFRGQAAEYWNCGGTLFLPVLLKSAIVSASWVCVYYAMRELPISIAAPIRATSPLGVFLGGLLIYGELPTLLQGIAMCLIFTGYCLFSLLGKMEGISFRNCRGIHLLLLGTFLGVVSALYDKYLLGVRQYPAGAVQFWFSILLVVILGLGCAFRYSPVFNRKKTSGTESASRFLFHWRLSIPLTGLLLIGADFLYFHSLSQPDAQVSILSLVRRSNCIVSFAVGSLFFHEKNKRRKAAALCVILMGILLLAW